jgi:hypothetical protein
VQRLQNINKCIDNKRKKRCDKGRERKPEEEKQKEK